MTANNATPSGGKNEPPNRDLVRFGGDASSLIIEQYVNGGSVEIMQNEAAAQGVATVVLKNDIAEMRVVLDDDELRALADAAQRLAADE